MYFLHAAIDESKKAGKDGFLYSQWKNNKESNSLKEFDDFLCMTGSWIESIINVNKLATTRSTSVPEYDTNE